MRIAVELGDFVSGNPAYPDGNIRTYRYELSGYVVNIVNDKLGVAVIRAEDGYEDLIRVVSK